MEFLDVVDENNELTGQTEDREVVHQKGLWHREVAVWIINEKEELLLQKRSANKKLSANKWRPVAGHIDAGEKPIHAAKRETQEEMGIKLKEEELEFLFTTKQSKESSNRKNNYFTYHYVVRTGKPIGDYSIQKEEVSELKYVALDELEKIIKQKDGNASYPSSYYMEELIQILKNKEEKR